MVHLMHKFRLEKRLSVKKKKHSWTNRTAGNNFLQQPEAATAVHDTATAVPPENVYLSTLAPPAPPPPLCSPLPPPHPSNPLDMSLARKSLSSMLSAPPAAPFSETPSSPPPLCPDAGPLPPSDEVEPAADSARASPLGRSSSSSAADARRPATAGACLEAGRPWVWPGV